MAEKELLAVSFGTSFAEARKTDIGGIEQALARAYPDYLVARAFSSPRVIQHVRRKDGEQVDSVSQALERALAAGIRQLVLQPTYLMHGIEYELMTKTLRKYEDRFASVAVAEPLLGDAGEDPNHYSEDMLEVAQAVLEDTEEMGGLCRDKRSGSNSACTGRDRIALVLMGHGTEHKAHLVYRQFQKLFQDEGRRDVFVATVDGNDPETDVRKVIADVKRGEFTHAILRPLMVVAGDHANNDMAGDREDSWKNLFAAAGGFEQIDCRMGGLGRLRKIQQIYVEHAGAAM